MSVPRLVGASSEDCVETRPASAPGVRTLLVFTAAGVVLGVTPRLQAGAYDGSPDDYLGFYRYIFDQTLGSYSDITALYFRDGLWRHPLPYLDYRPDYPVGTAGFIWLLNSFSASLMSYFLVTATILLGAALLLVVLIRLMPGARPWLLALSPTLPLYAVMNWDLLAILFAVAALVLVYRDREGWAGLLLALGIWTKFFPLILVPLVLVDRVLRRRWQPAVKFIIVLLLVSIAVNAPVALDPTSGGFPLRENWLYFFRFNQERPRELNLWNIFDEKLGIPLSTEQVNNYSALLLGTGVGVLVILLLFGRNEARPSRLASAALAAVSWWFLVNKVYSVQYSLWIAALLALAGAPTGLAVAFAGVDVIYFAASFVTIHLVWTGSPDKDWVYQNALWPAMAIRELAIVAIVGWAGWRLAWRDRRRGSAGGCS